MKTVGAIGSSPLERGTRRALSAGMVLRRGHRTALCVEAKEDVSARAEALLALCGASTRGGTVLVAEEAGEVLGVAVLRLAAPDAEIVALVTDPNARHRGVGRRLVEEMARRARIAACTRLRVRLPRADDATSCFFRALGFDDTHVALDLPL